MAKRVSLPNVALLRVVEREGKKGFMYNRRFWHDITADSFSAHVDGDKVPVLIFDTESRICWMQDEWSIQKRLSDQQSMLYHQTHIDRELIDKRKGAWLDPKQFELGTVLVIAGYKDKTKKSA